MDTGRPTSASKGSKVSAWLRLLRAPNLFTVPGDPIAGFVLAGGAAGGFLKVLPCVGTSLLFYCAGLILNDLFDLKEDRRSRPTRPLPAGRIRPVTAAIVAIVLLAAGYCLSLLAGTLAAIVAGALAAAIILYDARAKRIFVAGPINMGACRGLSLLLGAAPAAAAGLWSPAVLIASGLLTAYVAAITLIASGETGQSRLSVLNRFKPQRIQRMVGALIRLLLVYQAVVAVTAGPVGRVIAACLLAAWLVSALLARRIPAS